MFHNHTGVPLVFWERDPRTQEMNEPMYGTKPLYVLRFSYTYIDKCDGFLFSAHPPRGCNFYSLWLAGRASTNSFSLIPNQSNTLCTTPRLPHYSSVLLSLFFETGYHPVTQAGLSSFSNPPASQRQGLEV